MQENLKKVLTILNHNKRFQAIFLLLLVGKDFINSEKIASELNLSVRTVKKEIKLLREKLIIHHIDIFSRPFYGYKLIIENEELLFLLKQYFQISQAKTVNNRFESRVNNILRYLLASKKAVKVEDLQNKFYLSVNSPLTKELSQIKKIISQYNLTLNAKPYHGISIEGETYQKIMLIVRLYKYFNKIEHSFVVKDFEKFFICPIKEDIRRLFARTIVKHNVVFSDIYAERFIIYLCYFYNQQPGLKLPKLTFNYQQTNEFRFVAELCKNIEQAHFSFKFNEESIKFLTYIAIASTDLYRFKDCSEENYHNLIYISQQLHQTILDIVSGLLKLPVIEDETCRKDLLKMLIPISIKMLIKSSDDVDLGLFNQNEMESKPILYHTVQSISFTIEQQYGYSLSKREQCFIFDIFSGMINRIETKHKKLRLALISLNGRLSTQQLKFNLKHYFSDYIEKIETRMLYELETMQDHHYDYYLCNEYGRNMAIPYKPIYFAESDITENEYAVSLNEVFYHAFQYDEIFPQIETYPIKKSNSIDDFIEHKSDYESINIENKYIKIKLLYRLDADIENFYIYYADKANETESNKISKFIIANLNVIDNQQKLKMFINLTNKMAKGNFNLNGLFSLKEMSYKYFFTS